MKSPTILCALILIHSYSVQSMSMNFGNIFQKQDMPRATHQQQISSSNQPHQEQKIEYEYPPQYPSESYSEYRSESDPYLYNMSADQYVQSESWNSSYESSSNSSEANNQSVQNDTTTTTTTSTSTTTKVHSIPDVVEESHSTVVDEKKSTVSESPGVVWNKATESGTSTTGGPVVSAAANATSEKEEVVLGTAATTKEVILKTIFQKSIEWAKDEYILSILVPVAAGVIFAVTVICIIALCRCCRRCCRRRRFRKKCLPDSVRNLSTSDQKRLLGDMSSDDEF